MKKKNKKILVIDFLVLMVLFIYAIFGTDLIKDTKGNLASVSNLTKEEKIKLNTNENLSVYFVDVGQADCILIRYKDNNMLIDAGNNEDGPLLVKYFKDLGIEEFKYVVATHPHEDHIGGMDDIINNFKIDTYYMSDKITTTKTFEEVLDALEDNNMTYKVPVKGYQFELENAKFSVISPGISTSDINDSSIILKLNHGNNSFLFTGDAGSNVEKDILNEDISSDVLKVGHHGSSYSSNLKFLKRVNPKYAIISVGKNNTYKHPSNKTLEKLEKMNIKIYRTDNDGTIICTSDGKNIDFKTTSTNTNG